MPTQRKTQQPEEGSRQRLVAAAVRLFCRQGYEATVVKEIAREGAAPMGSFYFHFPGGKEQLGVVALLQGADDFAALLRATLEEAEPIEDAVAGCALILAERLERSDWLDGCPVATPALEAVARSPILRSTAAEAFRDWQDLIAERLTRAGLADKQAQDLAVSILALLEGAELLARVHAIPTPLHTAAASLRLLVAASRNDRAHLGAHDEGPDRAKGPSSRPARTSPRPPA
jgi:TetR/AcrR family transcriptional repressor of lmrAB and yxaGH operons